MQLLNPGLPMQLLNPGLPMQHLSHTVQTLSFAVGKPSPQCWKLHGKAWIDIALFPGHRRMAWQLTQVQTVTSAARKLLLHDKCKTQFHHALKHHSYAHFISTAIAWSCLCRRLFLFEWLLLQFSNRTNHILHSLSPWLPSLCVVPYSWKISEVCLNIFLHILVE